MTTNLLSVIEQIDIKAEAGLCQMTHQGARAFLQDVRSIAALALAAGQQALEQKQVEAFRTDKEIVAQTEELAVWLLSWAFNHKPETSKPMRESAHPFAERCWLAACHIQEMLTATDPENAVANMDTDAAHPQATVPAPKRPINCGTGHCSCIECVMEPAPSMAGEQP